MNINIDEKALHQLIIAEVRYGLMMDSPLMLANAIQHAKKDIPLMPVFGIIAAGQLKSEIENEMQFKNFSDADEWRLIDFLIWLNDFIIKWRAQ